MTNENRLRKIFVAPQFLLSMLQLDRDDFEKISIYRDGIPEDAVLVRWGYEDPDGRFVLIIRSHKFDIVPDGEQIPVLTPTYSRTQ